MRQHLITSSRTSLIMTSARTVKCCGTLSPRGPERPTQRRECQGSHRTETPPQQLSKQTSAARTRVGALVAHTLHESPHWWVPARHPRCTGARTTQHATEFLLTVLCNTSITKSHRSTARVPSSLIPASKELISDSVVLYETEDGFFYVQVIGTNVRLPKVHKMFPDVDSGSSRSPAKSES